MKIIDEEIPSQDPMTSQEDRIFIDELGEEEIPSLDLERGVCLSRTALLQFLNIKDSKTLPPEELLLFHPLETRKKGAKTYRVVTPEDAKNLKRYVEKKYTELSSKPRQRWLGREEALALTERILKHRQAYLPEEIDPESFLNELEETAGKRIKRKDPKGKNYSPRDIMHLGQRLLDKNFPESREAPNYPWERTKCPSTNKLQEAGLISKLYDTLQKEPSPYFKTRDDPRTIHYTGEEQLPLTEACRIIGARNGKELSTFEVTQRMRALELRPESKNVEGVIAFYITPKQMNILAKIYTGREIIKKGGRVRE